LSLLEEIVGRLVLTPELARAVRPSVVGEGLHGVEVGRQGQVVQRVVMQSASDRGAVRLATASGEVATASVQGAPVDFGLDRGTEDPPTVDAVSFRQRTGVEPSASIDSVGVRTRTVVATRATVAASQPRIRENEDLRRFAIGAVGEAGRAGVSPVEMSQFRRSGAGTRGRLVAAIEDFVSEEMTRHSAGLIRQGISGR
jgi:hypothetical protein